MSKPLLLLDVDGVLNAFGGQAIMRDKDRPRPWEAMFTADFLWFPSGEPTTVTLRIPRGTRERIARLAEVFEIAWCTAWVHNAHPTFAAALDLPDEPWGHVEFEGWDGFVLPNRSWKLKWVKKFVGDRPVVWLDDDIRGDVVDWADERNAAGIPTLIAMTIPHIGIEERHMDGIFSWHDDMVIA